MSKSIEVVGSSSFKLPQLPFRMINHSTIVSNDNKLMILGGTHNFDLKPDSKADKRSRKCFVLQGNKWIYHSMLHEPRNRSISICMPNGVYIFGGFGERRDNLDDYLYSLEFLATGTSTWRRGPDLPLGAEFICGGQGVAISETEIVILGGKVITHRRKDETTGGIFVREYPSKQIWKFHTITEEWQLIGNLKVSRFGHQAAYLHPNIVISGGWTHDSMTRRVVLKSTEIFNPHLPDFEPVLVSDLNVPRSWHVMRMILKNAIPTLVAFGGIDNEHGHLDSIEEWDPDNKKWKLLEQKLFHKRCF